FFIFEGFEVLFVLIYNLVVLNHLFLRRAGGGCTLYASACQIFLTPRVLGLLPFLLFKAFATHGSSLGKHPAFHLPLLKQPAARRYRRPHVAQASACRVETHLDASSWSAAPEPSASTSPRLGSKRRISIT